MKENNNNNKLGFESELLLKGKEMVKKEKSIEELRQQLLEIKQDLETKIDFQPGFEFTSENIVKVGNEIDSGLLFGEKWRLKI